LAKQLSVEAVSGLKRHGKNYDEDEQRSCYDADGFQLPEYVRV
jgi:hypothetical protein